VKLKFNMKSNPKHLAPILVYACISGALPGPTASAQTYVFNAASFATGSGATAVAEGDLNSDGKANLVVTGMNGSTGVISVLLGNSDGSFRTHVDYATGVNPKSVIVADLNHDGHLDIATAIWTAIRSRSYWVMVTGHSARIPTMPLRAALNRLL